MYVYEYEYEYGSGASTCTDSKPGEKALSSVNSPAILPHMEDRRAAAVTLLQRLVAATPVALLGVWLCGSGSDGRAVLGLFCVVAAGFIVGPGIAGLLAEPVGGLFFPRQPARREPCRGIAETRRARGEYEAAIAAYEEVIAEFPGDVESWIAMVTIALTHLRDPARADALARRALLALRDDAGRRQLLYAHRTLHAAARERG